MSDEIQPQETATVALGAFRRLSGRGDQLGYDRRSLAWVEDYIDSNRKNFSAEESEAFIGLVGAYLGECVRQTYGGHWKQLDGAWGIFFDEGGAAFPFSKAKKLVENAPVSGSITSFFDVLPTILKLPKK
jgi:hypothetical protein